MSSFRAIGAAGVTRVDFLVSPERDSFVVNELNTLPGSLSFYLWEASGLHFDALLTRLVEHGARRATASSRRPRRRSTRGCSLGGRAERDLSGDRGEQPVRSRERSRARRWRRARQWRPLLLLHGWGVSSELFAPILDALQQGRRLIVPDLPGFGATPEPPAPWSVHDYASWCIALLDRLGIAEFDLIGHSNGGRDRHRDWPRPIPDRVARMVLVGQRGNPAAPHAAQRRLACARTRRCAPSSDPVVDARGAAPDRQARVPTSADPRTIVQRPGVMRGTLVRMVNEDLRAAAPGPAAPRAAHLG